MKNKVKELKEYIEQLFKHHPIMNWEIINIDENKIQIGVSELNDKSCSCFVVLSTDGKLFGIGDFKGDIVITRTLLWVIDTMCEDIKLFTLRKGW